MFLNNWGESPELFLKRLIIQTPDNCGYWGGVEGTLDFSLADYYIIFDGYDGEENLKEEKRIYFGREGPNQNNFKDLKDKTGKYKFHYWNSHLLSMWWVHKPFNFLSSLKYEDLLKTKKLSCVMSGKRKFRGHILRYGFIREFVKKHNVMDLYGRGLSSEEFGDSYKGEILDPNRCKFTAFSNYSYSLCLENNSTNNWFTEKFLDSILGLSVPFYWGCPNLSEYFPSDSFIRLSIEKEDYEDSFGTILEEIVKPVSFRINGIYEARNSILFKYNVWPSIDRLIKYGELY